ncbi:hypothetical protein [Campylobacter sp. CCS1377]|uniref:Uncharacterized protein n=1 Tax=Campylobacter sp. CCS1377 TaxID=3158229 RepID=A0AAU7E491_9BACT
MANEKEFYEQIKALLKRYENEAKLVIAIALHCASPCTAMGIPVVLLADNYNEQKTRFGALKGIEKFIPYKICKSKK